MTSGSPAVAEAMSYDGFGAPTQFSGTLNGTPVGGVTLAYDGAGRISQKNDAWAFPMVVPQPPMSTAEWTYTYDEAGRLATATRTGEATRTYTYDARGNRSAISPSEDPAKAPDEQDRMPQVGHPGDADYTTYTYDDHGNVTDRTADGVTHTYRWDGEGSLLGVKQGGPDIVTYDVDAKGRRVGRRVGTNLTHQWFYDGQLRIVGEVVYGATPSYRVYGYVGERHLPVTMVETKGAITSSYRIFGDHLGSLRAVVRTSGTVGQVVQSMRHGPWGELEAEWLDAGFARVPFGFAGGVFETVTGLVRFGAREYDPRTGRWLTKDEARFGGGENFYAYAWGDPVDLTDWSGRRPRSSSPSLGSFGGGGASVDWDDVATDDPSLPPETLSCSSVSPTPVSKQPPVHSSPLPRTNLDGGGGGGGGDGGHNPLARCLDGCSVFYGERARNLLAMVACYSYCYARHSGRDDQDD